MRAFCPTTSLLALIALLALAPAALAAAEEQAPPGEIAYHALKPSIVSNLTGGPRYIRCDIQLMTRQADAMPKLELHEAALRHAILMLIAGQDGQRLKTREGKEDLRQQALASVQAQLQDLAGATIVEDLYFTNYYVK